MSPTPNPSRETAREKGRLQPFPQLFGLGLNFSRDGEVIIS